MDHQSSSRTLVLAALLLAMALPDHAWSRVEEGAAMDGRWHFVIAPYMWFSAIEGSVTVGNLPEVPVEASVSDIMSNFDFGLEGHFEARKDRLGLGGDFIWTNLGVEVRPDSELADFEVDVRQLIGEAFGFYRAASGGPAENPWHLDLLFGMRVTGTRTRLVAQTDAGEVEGDWHKLSWVDLMGGMKVRAPLGSRVALLGRVDIAGIGSDLTWNLEGDVGFKLTPRWSLGAGWRYMDIEYDDDDGTVRKLFDLAYNGPRFWAAYAW